MPINSTANRILRGMRESWNTDREYHENDIALCADRFLMSDVEEPVATEYYTPQEQEDAGKVLDRIIRVAEAKRYPFPGGLPVDVEDIAAAVAQERGLGAGGPDTYQSYIRVAELAAQVVSKGQRIVRLTEFGLVDAATGLLID